MTTITAPGQQGTGPEMLERLRGPWHDVVVLTRRNLVHIRREPMQLSDVTVQPVLFTLLFIYVFGSGIPIAGGSYKDFALAGLLMLNLTTSAMGTAVGLSTDLSTGVIDRFRTLPMWRAAVLVGRSISDVLAASLCVAIVALTGLAIGWRPGAGAASVLAGFAVALLFSYAVSWGCACLGLVSRAPSRPSRWASSSSFPWPSCPTPWCRPRACPAWLQAIADWNPVSAVTAACRHLFGNPNPSGRIAAWPMQHPVWAALGWSALMLAVFAPLAASLYRRRTTG